MALVKSDQFNNIQLYNNQNNAMKLNSLVPTSPKEKAYQLGLTSERFSYSQMSNNALQSLQYVKKKDRSDIKLSQWKNKEFYKTDATKQLFDCPNDISRQNADSLSVKQFVEKYEKNNLPVVIKGCTESWNQKTWSFKSFYDEYKQVKFKIGEDDDGYKLRVPLKYYLEYLVYNIDDSPLYLFESALEDKEETRKIIDNYNIPPYFKDDLFSILGEKKRPPYRWLLMGPERSGTTVHIDPLGTSAWNTSLVGHKRWVLFKQNLPKSIVKGKKYRGKNYEDEAINYFTEILPCIRQNEDHQQIKLIQFIQYPGETVFVPGGWWHAVINLDNTMAVTQNVMTHNNFDKVWRHLRVERRKLAVKFLEKLKPHNPELYERALQINEKDEYKMGQKYEKQSISMSFSSSSSSSSSSSTFSSSQDSESQSVSGEKENKVKRKNLVQKKSNSIRSRSYSRSREKIKRKNHSYSQEKQLTSNLSD